MGSFELFGIPVVMPITDILKGVVGTLGLVAFFSWQAWAYYKGKKSEDGPSPMNWFVLMNQGRKHLAVMLKNRKENRK